MAGVRAPRHARDLRRGRSKHRRGPMRGPAKPPRARTPARAFRPTAACGFANLGRGLCRRSLCGPDSFRRAGVLAGGAARAAMPRSRPPASEPLDVPPARAAKHAAPRAPARFARRTWQRTALGHSFAISPRRKTKARRFPAGLRVCGLELAPIRPCGASGAARDPRGPARPWKVRGRRPIRRRQKGACPFR